MIPVPQITSKKLKKVIDKSMICNWIPDAVKKMGNERHTEMEDFCDLERPGRISVLVWLLFRIRYIAAIES